MAGSGTTTPFAERSPSSVLSVICSGNISCTSSRCRTYKDHCGRPSAQREQGALPLGLTRRWTCASTKFAPRATVSTPTENPAPSRTEDDLQDRETGRTTAPLFERICVHNSTLPLPRGPRHPATDCNGSLYPPLQSRPLS